MSARFGDMAHASDDDDTVDWDDSEDRSHIPVNAKQPPTCTSCWLQHAGECP